MSAMPPLRDLQRDFARAALGGDAALLTNRIIDAGVRPDARLAIYRNNVHHSLVTVLAGNLPATRRLAGDVEFRAAAVDFLRRHPPNEPQLLAWGGAFPDHFANHAEVAGQPWLADLARLEWAREEVYYAADEPVLSPTRLAALPTDVYPSLRFRLHPSVRLISSCWPVYDLWRDPDAEMPPEPRSQCVLVARPEMTVRTVQLSVGEHALLTAFKHGAALAEATAIGLAAEPELDLMTALGAHLTGGSFTAVE